MLLSQSNRTTAKRDFVEVSILVVMDVALAAGISLNATADLFDVSILVVMDVALADMALKTPPTFEEMSQSLL